MIRDHFVCEVRCPIHGFIGLTELEREIVNQPVFQRLRWIKQLGWTDYVYPGASHTRFEHSLGVMHLASRLYEAVVGASEKVLKEVFAYTEAGFSHDWQVVRLAGLLHDVGHPPFSHATERLLPWKTPETYQLFPGLAEPAEQYEHEDYSVAIIETFLKDLIEQDRSNRRNLRVTTKEIAALISKRTPGGSALFWKDIISGQLDADRMDYLLRDSLHAGVSYGRFDLDRVVNSVCAIRRPEEESAEPKIAIMKGGIFAAEALIVARYWMHKQVYFHKTRLAFDHHLEKAVEEILLADQKFKTGSACFPGPGSAEELRRFLKWDDHRVMELLNTGQGGDHGERLMKRNHFRLVCEVDESGATVDELKASAMRNDRIVSGLGTMVKHVAQPKTLWYKAEPASELVLVDDDGKSQIGLLSEHSALMKSINFGFPRYVFADRSDAQAAREKFKTLLEEGSRTSGPPSMGPPTSKVGTISESISAPVGSAKGAGKSPARPTQRPRKPGRRRSIPKKGI